jgi:RHS repeat-associated protein
MDFFHFSARLLSCHLLYFYFAINNTTEYRYDLMGNMTGIRYPNTEVWLDYEYDKMGRVIAIPGFAGTRTNPGFTYDANSALAAVQMDNKIRTEYSRDRNGRVTGIIANSLSGEDILNLALGYDAANNIISRNDNAYIYDKVNRLQRATVRGNFEDKFTKADMILGTVAFDYFGDKEMVEEATDQTQVKLDYGARSLVLNLLTEAENICRIELTPEEAGHRVQVDQIKIFYKKNEYFTVLDKERWTAVKDDQGRIIITFDPYLTATELKIHCNFDDLDYWQQPVDRSEFYNFPENLVTVYQKVKYRTESYEYDAMGNRTVERHLLRKEYAYYYEYYAKSNRLKTNGRFAYEYDANGNLIRKGNRYEIDGETVTFVTSGEGVEYWEYYYDLFNRLEEVKKNGETVARYLYDPNGFRVEKLSSKGKVHYVQLLNGEVGYRKEITVNKEYSFIYFAGFHLARVDGVIGGTGKKYFYHNDHLGSALVVTDQDGNKVIERDFLPFGEIINLQEGPNPYADGSGFTGKDWDEEIGLYYFNARWYDPEIGRFISQDPAADDPNLYSYGYNNPLKFVDPNGMNAESFLGNVDIKIDIKGGMLNLLHKTHLNLGCYYKVYQHLTS